MTQYKILRISGLSNRELLIPLYINNPTLAGESYENQKAAIFKQHYIYTDSFSRGMRTLGHDAIEVIDDVEILQKLWAKENGVTFDIKNWHNDILLAQIRLIKPDIIFFQDIHSLPYSIRRDLKKIFPFIRYVIVHKGSHGYIDQMREVDLLLVGTPKLVKQCEEAGLHPYLMYHYFDEAVLTSLGCKFPKYQQYDFTFLGSSGYGFGQIHASRYWMLKELIEKVPIEVWLGESPYSEEHSTMNLEQISQKFRIHIRYLLKYILSLKNLSTLENLIKQKYLPQKIRNIILEILKEKQGSLPPIPPKRLGDLFPSRVHPPVFGLEMYRILQQSKITLHKHGDTTSDSVGALRLFQATGVGACLLTDTANNMKELFDENREIVTYSTVEECIEKMTYLLEHDNVRLEIAKAGQRRTLRDHTALNRCAQIDEILQKML